MKYTVRKTITGSFESIFSVASKDGAKFAASLGCDEFQIRYGEFAYLKDTITGRTEDGAVVSVPTFKVIVRFTSTTTK